MDTIPTWSRSDNHDGFFAALDEYGAVVVDNFLPEPVLKAFNTELDAVMTSESDIERGFANEAIGEFFGSDVSHVAGLAGKSEVFVNDILCHPLYMSACDRILAPSCSDYQLNIGHAMEREPGCAAQPLHRDAWVWKRIPASEQEIQLASIIALTDFTADNGGTLIVPGSHRWDDQRYPEASEAVAAAMPAGSAVVYLGNTFHAGGANITTNQRRRGVHVSYTLGWLRTEENQCLATPLEVARRLPQRAQELLGFGIHDDIEIGGGYLGTVELEPPHKIMAKEAQ